MGVFDNEDGVRRSIEFFNMLADQDRVTIVSDLNPMTFKLKQYHDLLAPLLSEVQRAISKYEDIAIGNRLVELGLDDTFARLFVFNIKKHAPTEAYQIHRISEIPDDVFSKSIDEIIKSVWVDEMSEYEVAEKFKITREQVRCIIDLSRAAMNALARGDMTKESIQKKIFGQALLDQIRVPVQQPTCAPKVLVRFAAVQQFPGHLCQLGTRYTAKHDHPEIAQRNIANTPI